MAVGPSWGRESANIEILRERAGVRHAPIGNRGVLHLRDPHQRAGRTPVCRGHGAQLQKSRPCGARVSLLEGHRSVGAPDPSPRGASGQGAYLPVLAYYVERVAELRIGHRAQHRGDPELRAKSDHRPKIGSLKPEEDFTYGTV